MTPTGPIRSPLQEPGLHRPCGSEAWEGPCAERQEDERGLAGETTEPQADRGAARVSCSPLLGDVGYPSALVSRAALTKSHKLGGLKQTFIVSLFRRPESKSKVSAGTCSLQSLQAESFAAASSFWRLPATSFLALRLYYFHFCLDGGMASFPPRVSVFLFPSYKNTGHSGWRAHTTPVFY